MAQQIEEQDPRSLIESVAIQPIFACGGRIIMRAGLARIVLWDQISASQESEIVAHEVVGKIIMPIESWWGFMQHVCRCRANPRVN